MGPPPQKANIISVFAAQLGFLRQAKLNAKELVEVVKKVGYKNTWGTYYGLDLIFSWTLLGSMGRLYMNTYMTGLKFYVEFR